MFLRSSHGSLSKYHKLRHTIRPSFRSCWMGSGALNPTRSHFRMGTFFTGGHSADQNLDGIPTGSDFNQFLANFAAGCG